MSDGKIVNRFGTVLTQLAEGLNANIDRHDRSLDALAAEYSKLVADVHELAVKIRILGPDAGAAQFERIEKCIHGLVSQDTEHRDQSNRLIERLGAQDDALRMLHNVDDRTNNRILELADICTKLLAKVTRLEEQAASAARWGAYKPLPGDGTVAPPSVCQQSYTRVALGTAFSDAIEIAKVAGDRFFMFEGGLYDRGVEVKP